MTAGLLCPVFEETRAVLAARQAVDGAEARARALHERMAGFVQGALASGRVPGPGWRNGADALAEHLDWIALRGAGPEDVRRARLAMMALVGLWLDERQLAVLAAGGDPDAAGQGDAAAVYGHGRGQDVHEQLDDEHADDVVVGDVVVGDVVVGDGVVWIPAPDLGEPLNSCEPGQTAGPAGELPSCGCSPEQHCPAHTGPGCVR